MQIVEIIKYIANDGKEFDDKLECMRYELKCMLKDNKVTLYDRDGVETIDATRAEKVIISSNKDLTELWNAMDDYYGFGADEMPSGEGTWVWTFGYKDNNVCPMCDCCCWEDDGCSRDGIGCDKGIWVKK